MPFYADKPKEVPPLSNHDGHCSARLAEELARRTGITVKMAMSTLEDLARELPGHIRIQGMI